MTCRTPWLRRAAKLGACLVAACIAAPAATADEPGAVAYSYVAQRYDPAGVAPLYPAGAVDDGSGGVYVASSGTDSIERISPAGGQSTVAADGYNRPRDVALDTTPGRLWVADTTNNAIRLITTTGRTISSLRSVGLRAPFGIAVDDSGIYVADAYNYRVVKLDRDSGAELWSAKSCAGAALDRPRDLTLGSRGEVFAVDTSHHRVVVLDPATGSCARAFGAAGTAPGRYLNPRGIAADGAGGLFIAEAKGRRVQHVTERGEPISASTSAGLNEPACAFVRGAQVGICDTFANRIVMYRESGGQLVADSVIGGTGPAISGFNEPFAAAFDPSGGLFVSDMFNHRVVSLGADLEPKLAFGTFGSSGGRFQFPRGMAFTPDGETLVVTDSENNRLCLFSSNGTLLRTIRPSGTSFSFPHQTVPAPDGTFWVADTNHNRVVHISSNGAVLGQFGVSTPRGLAMDASGSIYVSIAGASRIERYSPNGTLLATLATPGSGNRQVRQPWNLQIARDRLFIADGLNNRVLVLRTDGTYITQFDGSGTPAGRFVSPRGLAVGADGTVAVVSFATNRVTLWK